MEKERERERGGEERREMFVYPLSLANKPTQSPN